VIFDFKTGAYIGGFRVEDENEVYYTFVPGAYFRELGGIGSGLYFWVAGPGSNVKVSVQIGSRAGFAGPEFGTHTMGPSLPRPSPSGRPGWLTSHLP